jgi:hypothetical protein
MCCQRRKLDRCGLQPHEGRVADRADALVEVVVMVRQQIGRRRKSQQSDGCQRQDEDKFVRAPRHFVALLHLQYVVRPGYHHVEYRGNKESEKETRYQSRDDDDRERFLRVRADAGR